MFRIVLYFTLSNYVVRGLVYFVRGYLSLNHVVNICLLCINSAKSLYLYFEADLVYKSRVNALYCVTVLCNMSVYFEFKLLL
jgi:hypothetical protein